MSISCYPVSVVTLVLASRRHANSVQLGTKVSTRISSVGRPSGRKEGVFGTFCHLLYVCRRWGRTRCTWYKLPSVRAPVLRGVRPPLLPPPRAPLVPKPSSLLAPPLRPICLCHHPRAPELLIGYRDDQSDIATSSRFADRLSVIVLELCERYLHGSVVVCENCFWQLVSFGSLP